MFLPFSNNLPYSFIFFLFKVKYFQVCVCVRVWIWPKLTGHWLRYYQYYMVHHYLTLIIWKFKAFLGKKFLVVKFYQFFPSMASCFIFDWIWPSLFDTDRSLKTIIHLFSMSKKRNISIIIKKPSLLSIMNTKCQVYWPRP